MEVLRVKTGRRTQLVDVTEQVERAVAAAGVVSGVCYLYVPHTTAGVMINEHFDLRPKAVLTGTSQMIFVDQGKLVLGQWQGVFFCEFDGPRERKMWVRVMGDVR